MKPIFLNAVAAGLLFVLSASGANAILVRDDLDPKLAFAKPSDFPAVFPLHTADNGARKICAATLIRARWAITAAHCINGIAGRLIKGQSARVSHKVRINGRENTVDSVFVHPEWQGSGGFDVVLLRLTWPEKKVSPMSPYLDPLAGGMTISLVGWGAHGNGRDGVLGDDGRLRFAENRIRHVQDFWFSVDFSDPVTKPVGSLKHEGIGGSGDSGGPALFDLQGEWHIAGVRANQANPEGAVGHYGTIEAYIPIAILQDWIDRITE